MNETHGRVQTAGGQAVGRSGERAVAVPSGWLMLGVNLGLLVLAVWWLVRTIRLAEQAGVEPPVRTVLLAVLLLVAAIVALTGHFALQPNHSRVLILFGSYRGTVRTSGFHWANPFYTKRTTLSLRAHNFTTDKLKVNDKRGNPIEIAAVVVWRVRDTAQASFDVENYREYVAVQSESAVRHLAGAYAYDQGEDDEVTLRSGGEEVAEMLAAELQQRLDKAGVVVEEARITHLAYAPEIAQAMLRRQQAEAIIAARTKIVHGAVSMVEMALHELAEKQVVEFDEERRAAMVSNLLVVLCAEAEVSPVINTGTLYQ